MVVLVEVMRKAYLASVVPVIVNAILNEHQVIVDIIAFVSKGDFPRSRLGEKQRGKILASWVTRKMRTIAQFGIRDADGADSQITEVAEPRSGVGSVVGKGSSLRNVESASGGGPLVHDYRILPAGISEMPAMEYESSIVESPPIPTDEDRNETPTETRNDHFPLPTDQTHFTFQQSTESPPEPKSTSSYQPPQPYDSHPNDTSLDFSTPDPSKFNFTPTTVSSQSRYESKPPVIAKGRDALPSQARFRQETPPVPPLPADYGGGRSVGASTGGAGGGGKLRITNVDSDEVEWPQEAIMHMNLAGGGTAEMRSDARVDRRGNARGGTGHGGGGWDNYDGRGYGNAI